MGMLTVDKSTCKHCGNCAEVCPSGIIQMRGKEKFPEIPAALEKACLVCGHCVSVCPCGALEHGKMHLSSCPPIDSELVIDATEVRQFLRARRSIRLFKAQPVEKATIETLIDTARYAPTASNSQLVRWLVVTDPEVIRNTADLTVAYMQHMIDTGAKNSYPVYYPPMVAAHKAGADPILRRAPALIIASTPAMRSNGMVDVTLGLTYLELMATSMGLGTCWAGMLYSALLNYPPVKALLGIAEDRANCYPMMLGYPKYRYYRLPERKAAVIDWR